MVEALTYRGGNDGLQWRDPSTVAKKVSGEVIELADGRAAVVMGLLDLAANDAVTYETDGVFTLLKQATISCLVGGRAYWDRSAGKVTPLRSLGDFYCGYFVNDAAAADATVRVQLNRKPRYRVGWLKGGWTTEATLGLGVAQVGVGAEYKLTFDAVAEAAQAALFSVDTVVVADSPIFEAEVAIFDIGDNAALDFSVGLANASHATDFDSVTESAIIHLDGNALDILAESDDGTTQVAATDTTKNAVDNTYFELWIDARNIDDIQFYIDGVNVLAATVFKLDAATGPLLAIAHIEKTSDNTLADLRIRNMRIRSTDLAQ